VIYSPDPTAAFHGGNPQSKAAHESVKAIKATRGERLLRFFMWSNWTTDELEAVTGWTHQGLSPRIVELRKAGLIVATNETRATRSGRQARVYELAGG
jgi:hypothetical protein